MLWCCSSYASWNADTRRLLLLRHDGDEVCLLFLHGETNMDRRRQGCRLIFRTLSLTSGKVADMLACIHRA